MTHFLSHSLGIPGGGYKPQEAPCMVTSNMMQDHGTQWKQKGTLPVSLRQCSRFLVPLGWHTEDPGYSDEKVAGMKTVTRMKRP